MSIQYQTDEQGNRVAVVIQLAEWEAIRERLAGERPVAAFGLTPEEARPARARLGAFPPGWAGPGAGWGRRGW